MMRSWICKQEGEERVSVMFKRMQRARGDDTGFPQLHSQLPLNLHRISALTLRALMIILQNKLNNTLTNNVDMQVRTFKTSRDEFGAERKKRSSKPKTTRSRHSSAA
jgi:hypothetical protein